MARLPQKPTLMGAGGGACVRRGGVGKILLQSMHVGECLVVMFPLNV